ncbi:MAG: general transcription repressor [Vezdaea acicularis]|nr:MAG: general transcription repressor [Vezdaea acicularis]
MYNAHRGMVPTNTSTRLTELLDQVRAEFENQGARGADYEHQLSNQLQEMEIVRQKLHQLEQTQLAIKQRYDEDVARLHRELAEARGAPSQPPHLGGPPHSVGPSQAPPPNIGQGGNNLFGPIMTNGVGGGAGLAPPQEAQHHPANQMPQPQPPPVLQPPGPPHPPQFPSYQSAPAPTTGYPPQPPQSPGPGKRGAPRGGQAPGPATPQQPAAYNDIRASPHVTRPTPPPQHAQGVNVGNKLADLDAERMPDTRKKEGNDWYAVFNPRVQRVLDVDLVHNLSHESVVCCVRFSRDGRYVATGCNKTAQIYDVRTGSKVCVLEDKNVEEKGDLYIRSVCFSPDGRYLATGAEDKLIRVWDIGEGTIKQTFAGHEQDIYSLDFAQTGRIIASGSGDRSVRLWDVERGVQTLVLTIEDGVTTVAISHDARYVAAGSLDKSVRVWDTETGFLVERLEGPRGHKDSVYSVAFSPNGRELVSGSLDKTIKLWEFAPNRAREAPQGGKCIRTFEGHKDFVLSVALTQDSRWVLSGSKDRGVQFWDPLTGDAQLMLQGHKNSGMSPSDEHQACPFGGGAILPDDLHDPFSDMNRMRSDLRRTQPDGRVLCNRQRRPASPYLEVGHVRC